MGNTGKGHRIPGMTDPTTPAGVQATIMSSSRDTESPQEASEEAPLSTRKKVLVWVERLVTLAIAAFILVRLGPQAGALVGFAPGQGAEPDYTLVTYQGDTIQSADLLGKVVVVNFWATWCPPCRLEMPALQKLHERRAGDEVVVLGFATDVGGGDLVRAFLRDEKITYDVGQATTRHRQAFGGINGIPTTFIIDRQGVVRHRVVGFFAPPAMNAAVSRLLDEEASTP